MQNNRGKQTLFRPVGLKELLLIEASGMRKFPKRLEEQPVFYPVLNKEYARQITRDWNTKNNSGIADQVGFVMAFELPAEYANRFEIHQVGNTTHRELWVPADELDDFNDRIIGKIRVIETYYGEDFVGEWPIIDEKICFPHNLAVITTASILDKMKSIGHVVHDEEGDWQFLPLTDDLDSETPKVVGLGEIVALEPSVVQILHMKTNKVAWRTAERVDWTFGDKHE